MTIYLRPKGLLTNTGGQEPILAKAFDQMNHEAIVTSLMKMVLPKILTNKIINACLREHTSIQWFEKKIEHQRKTRGIKHGCSLPPRLFAIGLEHAIDVTRGALRNFNTDSQLQPPTRFLATNKQH